MENSKLFYFNIEPFYLNSFIQLMAQFDNITVTKLEDLSDIIKHGQRANADFLVLDGNTPAKLLKEQLQQMKGATLNTKLIWISNEIFPNEFFNTELVAEYFKKIEVLQVNQSILKKMTIIYDFINDNEHSNKSKEETLIPLSIIYLKTIKKSPCDIFLKLNENKYVKIISKDDDFKIEEIIQKYESKNIHEFYIAFSSLTKFRDNLLKGIFKFDPEKDTRVTHQIKVAESAIAIAKDFGVNDFLIEGVSESFNDIYKEFNTNAKIRSFLEDLSKLNGTEIGTHSYLVSIFATVIGNNIPWFNKEIKKNIYTSALFHDLDLINTGLEEFEFKSINEINMLSSLNKDFIKNHPASIAKKLSKVDVIPTDVINIITKHHEGAGENSYPQKLHGTQLSPTICLFIVAHEFSIQLKNFNYQSEYFNNILGNTRQLLSGNTFTSYIDILENKLM